MKKNQSFRHIRLRSFLFLFICLLIFPLFFFFFQSQHLSLTLKQNLRIVVHPTLGHTNCLICYFVKLFIFLLKNNLISFTSACSKKKILSHRLKTTTQLLIKYSPTQIWFITNKNQHTKHESKIDHKKKMENSFIFFINYILAIFILFMCSEMNNLKFKLKPYISTFLHLLTQLYLS